MLSPTIWWYVPPRVSTSLRCAARLAGLAPVSAGRAGRDAGRTTDQGLAFGPAGHRDDDPFAGLPGLRDVVLVAVQLQGLVDLVGGPQQCQLA